MNRISDLIHVTSQSVSLVFVLRYVEYNDFENDFDNQNYFFGKQIVVSWIVLDKKLDETLFEHSKEKLFIENYLKKTFDLIDCYENVWFAHNSHENIFELKNWRHISVKTNSLLLKQGPISQKTLFEIFE